MKRVSILALLAVAVLSACGDDDPIGPTPASSYTATVAGDLTATLTGAAFFGSETNEQGEPVFAIVLADTTAEHVVVLGYPGTTRPAKGSYELENPLEGGDADGWTVLHTAGDGEELLAMFMATAGEIVITESSADRMKGTFEYEGLAILGAEPGAEPVEITVEGTFDAEPAPAGASLAVATTQPKF